MAADGALRHSPSEREHGFQQLLVPPRPGLRDMPALLRGGLTLRWKRDVAVGLVSGRVLRSQSGRGWRARGAHAHPRGGQGGHLEVGKVPVVEPLCQPRQKRSLGRQGRRVTPAERRFPFTLDTPDLSPEHLDSSCGTLSIA